MRRLMKNGLERAYELIVEKTKEGTISSSLKPGQSAMGELKKSKEGGPEKTGVKKPTEGEAKINPGHGKIKTESRELRNMLPQSKFDNLFSRQIVEADEPVGDESPVEITGNGEFNDDQGDFPSEDESGDDVGEEVDVATELRLIIDRLSEVAERLGAFDGNADDADMDTAESSIEDDLSGGEGLDDEEQLAPESVQANTKPFKNSAKAMQAKNNKVNSAFKASGKKASTTGHSKDSSGKLVPFRKTTLGPNMSQKADVKGVLGKTGAGIFDSI